MGGDMDAQRILEQKALANARALVDKVQAEDRERSANAVGVFIGVLPVVILVFALFGAIAATVAYVRKVPPQNVAPSRTPEEYVERVFDKIEKKANGEMRSELQGLNGNVQLAFDVRRNGIADDFEVRQASSDASIDRAASRVVKLSGPFERIPESFPQGPMRIGATIRFGSSGGAGGVLVIERKVVPAAALIPDTR
jgi:hypothetical protein